MECGERPAAQVLAAPQPLRSWQWLLCGMHLYLATGRCWPKSAGRLPLLTNVASFPGGGQGLRQELATRWR
jgi:hypothetical protein